MKRVNDFNRLDYFLAQICQVVAQVQSEHPDRIKIDPFLLKFKPGEAPKPLSDEDRKAKALENKKIWLAYIQDDGKVKDKTPVKLPSYVKQRKKPESPVKGKKKCP